MASGMLASCLLLGSRSIGDHDDLVVGRELHHLAGRSISNAIFPSFAQTPRACSPSSLLSFSAIQIIAP